MGAHGKRGRQFAHKAKLLAAAHARDYVNEVITDRNVSLRSLGYASYKEYLDSDLWSAIRARVAIREDWKCAVCHQALAHVHHRSYEAMVLRGDADQYLIGLCQAHHRLIEFKSIPVYCGKKVFWATVKCLPAEVESRLVAVLAGEHLRLNSVAKPKKKKKKKKRKKSSKRAAKTVLLSKPLRYPSKQALDAQPAIGHEPALPRLIRPEKAA